MIKHTVKFWDTSRTSPIPVAIDFLFAELRAKGGDYRRSFRLFFFGFLFSRLPFCSRFAMTDSPFVARKGGPEPHQGKLRAFPLGEQATPTSEMFCATCYALSAPRPDLTSSIFIAGVTSTAACRVEKNGSAIGGMSAGCLRSKKK
jgi:hypothetical protein